jgi:hypothetical protein
MLLLGFHYSSFLRIDIAIDMVIEKIRIALFRTEQPARRRG